MIGGPDRDTRAVLGLRPGPPEPLDFMVLPELLAGGGLIATYSKAFSRGIVMTVRRERSASVDSEGTTAQP